MNCVEFNTRLLILRSHLLFTESFVLGDGTAFIRLSRTKPLQIPTVVELVSFLMKLALLCSFGTRLAYVILRKRDQISSNYNERSNVPLKMCLRK